MLETLAVKVQSLNLHKESLVWRYNIIIIMMKVNLRNLIDNNHKHPYKRMNKISA